MADQIVITEKSSQAKDVRAAVGSRYGPRSRGPFIRPANRKMSCRRGSAGRRSCCGPKGFTALARQKAATKPLSSELFASHYVPPSGFGWPPTATARVSSSARKFLSIMSTAVGMRVLFTAQDTHRANASGGARYDSETALIAESFRHQSSRPDQSCNRMPAKPRT